LENKNNNFNGNLANKNNNYDRNLSNNNRAVRCYETSSQKDRKDRSMP